MRKLCLSTKFPHQEIRWNYGIFRSLNLKKTYNCTLLSWEVQPLCNTSLLYILKDLYRSDLSKIPINLLKFHKKDPKWSSLKVSQHIFSFYFIIFFPFFFWFSLYIRVCFVLFAFLSFIFFLFLLRFALFSWILYHFSFPLFFFPFVSVSLFFVFFFSFYIHVNIQSSFFHLMSQPIQLLLFRSSRLETYNFIKKKTLHRCFPENFARLSITLFLPNTSGRLLLPTIAQVYFFKFLSDPSEKLLLKFHLSVVVVKAALSSSRSFTSSSWIITLAPWTSFSS